MEGNSKPHAWKQVFMYPNILVEKIRMCLNVPGLQGAQSRKAVLWQAKICSYTTETSPSSRLKKRLRFSNRFRQTHDLIAGHHCSEWLTVSAVLRCISVLLWMPARRSGNHAWHSTPGLWHTAEISLQLWSSPWSFSGSAHRAEPLKSGLINQWLSLS